MVPRSSRSTEDVTNDQLVWVCDTLILPGNGPTISCSQSVWATALSTRSRRLLLGVCPEPIRPIKVISTDNLSKTSWQSLSWLSKNSLKEAYQLNLTFYDLVSVFSSSHSLDFRQFSPQYTPNHRDQLRFDSPPHARWYASTVHFEPQYLFVLSELLLELHLKEIEVALVVLLSCRPSDWNNGW